MWPNQLAAKVRVRFMVMRWLEGGQGEVRGACPPPPPHDPLALCGRGGKGGGAVQAPAPLALAPPPMIT